MAAKTRRTPRKTTRRAAAPARTLETLRASALGAVDTIIRQGAALQDQGRRAAAAKVREARATVIAGAGEARARTRRAVSRLEHVFEQRVSQAMAKLGMPTARDVRALSRQVAELQQSVERLRRARPRA